MVPFAEENQAGSLKALAFLLKRLVRIIVIERIGLQESVPGTSDVNVKCIVKQCVLLTNEV